MTNKPCESCGIEEFEHWEGSDGLDGTRCINQCWPSYKIDQEGPAIRIPKFKRWDKKRKK